MSGAARCAWRCCAAIVACSAARAAARAREHRRASRPGALVGRHPRQSLLHADLPHRGRQRLGQRGRAGHPLARPLLQSGDRFRARRSPSAPGPATENSQTQYNAAITEYAANNLVGTDAAFHRMGRALHFIQDMTSPAHTHDDDHALGDDFEGWGPGNFPAMNFSTVTPKYATPADRRGLRPRDRPAHLRPDRLPGRALRDRQRRSRTASSSRCSRRCTSRPAGSSSTTTSRSTASAIGAATSSAPTTGGFPTSCSPPTTADPAASTRHQGSAYVENTGGDGGPVVPVVFGGQPNTREREHAADLRPPLLPGGDRLRRRAAAGLRRCRRRAAARRPRRRPQTVDRDGHAHAGADRDASPLRRPRRRRPPPRRRAGDRDVDRARRPPRRPRRATRDRDADVDAHGHADARRRLATATASPTPSSARRAVTATPSPIADADGDAALRGDAAQRLRRAVGRRRRPSCSCAIRRRQPRQADSGAGRRATRSSSQFGTPLATTDYALCIYDRSGGVASPRPGRHGAGGRHLRRRAVLEAAGARLPLQEPRRQRRRRAVDPAEGRAGRPRQVPGEGEGRQARHAAAGRAREVLAQDPAVTVQLVNSAGFCWEATYSAPAQRNQSGRFSDKSD